MDQLDFRYKDLREQLYTLGFNQQLPIGSMSIVSALLEDLIKVTDSYKQSKETVKNLIEEKRAWVLGIEPYKCDNSRLLSENNALHLELIKQRGEYEKKILDLKHTVRNLEVDKNYLDDHCFELVSKISEMEHRGRGAKATEDGKVKHKKAFVSTVPGGIPPYPQSSTSRYHSSRRCEGKSNANDLNVQVVILQNENQLLKDEINSLKKQLESRDNEITRLHQQLSGGRPVAALGRDCCYRGIDTLTEDMKLLQQQLIATKKELSESLEQQHEAKLRAIKLDGEKKKYAKELKEMEEFALKFQDEANAKLVDREREVERLVDRLNDSLRKIAALEAVGRSSSSTSQQTKIVENMKAALKKANEENDNLMQRLFEYEQTLTGTMSAREAGARDSTSASQRTKFVENIKAALKKTNEENDNLIERLVNDEQKYTAEIKILTRKNSKLEEKIQLLQAKDGGKPQKRLLSKATITESQNDIAASKEKILLQTEYLRRLNQPVYERELENVQAQLAMREIEIDKLKEQLYSQPKQKPASSTLTSISVQSAMSRMERETEALKSKIEVITSEREDLKKNLKEVVDDLHNEQLSYTTQMLRLTDQIKQLEIENRVLREYEQTGTSNGSKIVRLTEKVNDYERQLEELNMENRKLKSSYNQIKILQEQTEKSLIDYQNRLVQAENDLAQTTCEQSAMDAKFTFTNKTISNLKDEAVKLKSIIDLLEKDRNEMLNHLDVKTEQVIHMDTELSKLRSDNAELNSKTVALRRQMSCKSNENVEKMSTIQRVTQETEILRKQVEHFKELNENLTAENSRLCLEINDLTFACKELKKRQGMSEAEADRLKESIKEYVFKIKEVEDTLSLKKTECDRMLDHFNEFESGAKELERTNQSLEMENEETSRRLNDAANEIQHLQEILNERDNEIAANNRQIAELNNQLTDIERELKRRDEEIELQQENANAIRVLCNKLDIEKEKLKEELNECNIIRRKLEQENEKLRKESTANDALDQQGAVQRLQELLKASKEEVEQHRATLNEKATEIQKLRAKMNELKDKCAEEEENAKRYQGLAQENSVQVQELNRKLTNYRYEAKVNKDKEQKEEYDRNKILLEQTPSGKYLESISTNSNYSRTFKELKSSSRTDEPPVTLYKRTPLSVIKPSTSNGKKRTSRLDDTGSSEEIGSTINPYISKTHRQRPSRKGENEKLSRAHNANSNENIDGSVAGSSKGISSANQSMYQSSTSTNQHKSSRNEPVTDQSDKTLSKDILPNIQISFNQSGSGENTGSNGEHYVISSRRTSSVKSKISSNHRRNGRDAADSHELSKTFLEEIPSSAQISIDQGGKAYSREKTTSNAENIAISSKRTSSVKSRTSSNHRRNGRDGSYESSETFLEEIPSSVQVSVDVNQKETATESPLNETSISQKNHARLHSESRDDFFTCASSSTIPYMSQQESLPSLPPSEENSTFDTSFLRPPPPVKEVVIGYKSNKIATFNIEMDSYMGPIQAFRGDYVIKSIK